MSSLKHAFRVLDELDLQVLIDQKDEEGHACYSAGWANDLGAGIYGHIFTPCFDTQEELYDWINDNENSLRKAVVK